MRKRSTFLHNSLEVSPFSERVNLALIDMIESMELDEMEMISVFSNAGKNISVERHRDSQTRTR
jgi:hypothetical protein